MIILFGEPMHTESKGSNGPLNSNTNQDLVKRHHCNQGSYYEKYEHFHYARKPSCATTKSTLFAVSKDEWNTLEDTG